MEDVFCNIVNYTQKVYYEAVWKKWNGSTAPRAVQRQKIFTSSPIISLSTTDARFIYILSA